MNLLAIDTASASASAALYTDGALKAEIFAVKDRAHSFVIMPMIEALLDCAGISVSELDTLAAVCGPGSFTGVRIGVSTIKGLALARALPCAKVNSLRALCYNTPFAPALVACMMDARRDQVYAACFRWYDGEPVEVLPETALDVKSFLDGISALGEDVIFVGDGAERHFGLAREMLGERARLAPAHLLALRASSAAECAVRMISKGETVQGHLLAPHYLRESSAQRLFKERAGG